ncbi:MAG: [Alistipes sp.]|nr:[FeFe] hydrogenase H-cluster maturation GTPase HydF [Alistipes sp.]
MRTPNSERVHIAIFGNCNSGKSSLINAITGEQTAIVSDVAGTTTDLVKRAVELPNIGAALLIDTPGLDDNTALGTLRTEQRRKALMQTDIAIVLLPVENKFLAQIHSLEIPVIQVTPKADIATEVYKDSIAVSATTGEGINSLITAIAGSCEQSSRLITEGVCSSGDTVVLVMPQDSSAPKGRLIKPQVEVIRELLDRGCSAICCQPDRLAHTLSSLAKPPQVVIADSSAFAVVKPLVPQGVRLTSFSILFAAYKGDIELFREGAKHLLTLPPTARILIAEACSHTPQNEDIGRVKLPRILRKKLGDEIRIETVSGADFPTDLTPYDIVIHCGACMFTRRYVLSRIAQVKAQGVAMTNYGVAIAALLGIETDK